MIISVDSLLVSVSCDGYAFFIAQQERLAEAIFELSKKFVIPLVQLIEEKKFTGAAGTSLVACGLDPESGTLKRIFLFGIGAAGARQLEAYRRAVGLLVRQAEQCKIASVALQMPLLAESKLSPEYLGRETAIAAELAGYHFEQYITDNSRKHTSPSLALITEPSQQSSFALGVAQGQVIAVQANYARLLIDTPPHFMNPVLFAQEVAKTGKEYALATTIYTQDQCIALGMGGIEGVSQGSLHDGFLTLLEYKTDKADAPTVALVGKGVTFDSGGLSIKPAASMENMKDDMSGAAAVLATMRVIAQLKPAVNVIGLMPLVENMPSGTALRPGDILRFYNGKTAEVKNTDAEGRLILADALSYAVKNYKLDAIIDIATLTGACAHALGGYYAALMGKHESLLAKIETAASLSGERVWQLPFDDDYKAAITSSVADISNIGSPKYMAGTITAGFFLSHFVGEVPWAHLDIAGTAFGVPDISYYRQGVGATGFGVRLFTDLLLNWNK